MITYRYVLRALLILVLLAGCGVYLVFRGMKKEASFGEEPLFPSGCLITFGLFLIVMLVAYLILLWRCGWF